MNPPGSSVHGIFPGKNTGVGCRFSPPGDLPNPGIKPASPALAGRFLTIVPSGTMTKPLTKLSDTENGTVLLAGRG